MPRPYITVVTHLKEKRPPAWKKLEIVLREIVKAIYGEHAVLKLERGSVGDNEFENMVQVYSSMNPGIQAHAQGILDRQFGPHFIVGYAGDQLEGNRTDELDAAEGRINERLQES